MWYIECDNFCETMDCSAGEDYFCEVSSCADTCADPVTRTCTVSFEMNGEIIVQDCDESFEEEECVDEWVQADLGCWNFPNTIEDTTCSIQVEYNRCSDDSFFCMIVYPATTTNDVMTEDCSQNFYYEEFWA